MFSRPLAVIMMFGVTFPSSFGTPVSSSEWVDCGNSNRCGPNQTCMTSEPVAGRRYGCSPLPNAVATLDPKYSCPARHTYDPRTRLCVSQLDSSSTQQVMNVDATTARLATATDVCALYRPLLSWACDCEPTGAGNANFSCRAVIRNVSYWARLEANLCHDPASSTFSYGRDETVTAVITERLPLSLWVPVPDVSLALLQWIYPEREHPERMSGLEVGAEMHGNLRSLRWRLGFRGCVFVGELQPRVCLERTLIDWESHEPWACQVV